MVILEPVVSIHKRYSGYYRVYGTVRNDVGQAIAADVTIMDVTEKMAWRSMRTAADGVYAFNDIDNRQWLVIAQNTDNGYHPDIVRVQAEPMP